MASFKVFVSLALLVVCFIAAQAQEVPSSMVDQSAKVYSPNTPQPSNIESESNDPKEVERKKKHAIIYDAAPAIAAYSYPAVPTVLSAYSYQYHRSIPYTPYAYSAAYYPYAYPTWYL